MISIVDISCAMVSGRPYKKEGLNVSGLRYALGIISNMLADGNVAIVFNGVVNRELSPVYLSGRVPDYSAYAQNELLREILRDCNVPFYYEDGIDSKDIIFSMVDLLVSHGYTEYTNIEIHSDNPYLACVAGPSVTVYPISEVGTVFDDDTSFPDNIVDGVEIPLNTYILYRVLHNKKFKGSVSFSFASNEFVKLLRPYIEDGMSHTVFSHKDVLRGFLLSIDENINKEGLDKALDEECPLIYQVSTVPYDEVQDKILSSKYSKEVTLEHMFLLTERSKISFIRFDNYLSELSLLRYKKLSKYDKSIEGRLSEMLKIFSVALDDCSIASKANHYTHADNSIEELINMEIPL